MQDDRVRNADSLSASLDWVASLLPAQGPIDVFVHHNPLHAFEEQPFEEAILHAASLFDCEPYLSESRYREELSSGRIQKRDLRAVLEDELGASGDVPVIPGLTRIDLRLQILLHGLDDLHGPELAWLLSESHALETLRHDLSLAERRRLSGTRSLHGNARRRQTKEALLCKELWEASKALAERVKSKGHAPRLAKRIRDWTLAQFGFDIEEWLHPFLIRASAAYLDQGISFWPAPAGELGFFDWVALLHADARVLPKPWYRQFSALLREERSAKRDALQSIEHSLIELHVPEDRCASFLMAESRGLPGWGGMMHQMDERPDRAPGRAPKASFRDFMAVRLLGARACLLALQEEHPELRASLPNWCSDALPAAEQHDGPLKRAWLLYQVAQVVGLSARELRGLDKTHVQELWQELHRFPGLERRRCYQLAYERRHRLQYLDALGARSRHSNASEARVQAIFCLDEREESLRRHVEELDPSVETYGTAGHFGVAMYHRALDEASPRPLCPVSVIPKHLIVEEELLANEDDSHSTVARTSLGHLERGASLGSRTLVRGTAFSLALGALSVLPLVLRVLFPRWTAGLRARSSRLLTRTVLTRLHLDAEDPPREDSQGRQLGFTLSEMSEIVATELENIGLVDDFAPLVVFVGHGSSSLNNPQESAHDCGACGGGRGGPNARAIADMANRSEIRTALAQRGIQIPDSCYFVGAYHNTCDDSVTYYDRDHLPQDHRLLFAEFVESMDWARAQDAKERCRRFLGFPLGKEAELALRHVEARSQDLGQPRPEYGHAGNASCFIGKRSSTRGLYLDRRCFLQSYDCARDSADGRILTRIIESVIPVVAGINLEYWFGYVDPVGYGCSTKLPHNVSGLLGVMEGHASDLRTGLPWQMVEIHEPVRLVVCVEASAGQVRNALENASRAAMLVKNRWIELHRIDPETRRIESIPGLGEEARAYEPETVDVPLAESSADHYAGNRGPVVPAHILASDLARQSEMAEGAEG